MRPDARGRNPLPVERFFQCCLLGLVASGYLALAGSAYLDVPTIAIMGAGILLRALLIAGVVRLNLSERVASIAAVGYLAIVVPIDYLLLSHEFLIAILHFAFFLAVTKILTAATNRDDLYVAIMAFLQLLAGAILSTSPAFFLCLALFLLFAIATLASGEIRRAIRKSPATARTGVKYFHSRLALLVVWIAFGILTLTAFMFFLLPRTAGAALAGLISRHIHAVGYSERMTLGETGEMKVSSRAVMHVAIYGNYPMGAAKWRGDVLTEFDGRVWSRSPRDLAEHRIFATGGEIKFGLRQGEQRSYRVEFTDIDSFTLFFAGTPETVQGLPDGTRVEPETECFRLPQPQPSGFRYDVFSALEEPPETALPLYPSPTLNPRQRDRCLRIPSLDPRIGMLAESMASGATSDLARARAIEQRLRSDYRYTLELPQREVKDPLAEFLFTRRKGHCEYFASAMAVMLRTLNIPSRVATGFQTGIYNPISDLWLVRASDAHAWVEAWIPGRGWTTFDPTPPDPSAHSLTLFSRAALYFDAAETFWQQWVVGYDPKHQGTLADRIEQATRRFSMGWSDSFSGAGSRWAAVTKAWFQHYGAAAGVAFLIALVLWRFGPKLLQALRMRRQVERVRRGEADGADATLLYERMLHVLHRKGYQKPVWFTPVEFARSLATTPIGRPVEEFTEAYNAVRFGGRTEAAPRMTALLDELERPRKP